MHSYVKSFIMNHNAQAAMETLISEIYKFLDPIVVPDPVQLKFVATYYKQKPKEEQKSPKKLIRTLSNKSMTAEEASNKIVEIMCSLFKIKDDLYLVNFHKEEGSVEAFDEVLLFLQPTI